MRAEYKQQARLHDTICPEKSVDGDKIVIKLNDTEAEPYAVVGCELKDQRICN